MHTQDRPTHTHAHKRQTDTHDTQDRQAHMHTQDRPAHTHAHTRQTDTYT